MIKNYFIIAWRNLVKNKLYSFVNIAGLSAGMAVALLIGLWVWNELSFDKDNKNYPQLAQVMQRLQLNGEVAVWNGLPYPLAAALRKKYSSDFAHVTLSNNASALITSGEKNLSPSGLYMDPEGPRMLDLTMQKGSLNGLQDPNSILLSASSAKAIFGDADPINKIVQVEHINATVTGVYNDFPDNSSFAHTAFIAPWQLKLQIVPTLATMENPWGRNGFQVFVQMNHNGDAAALSRKISSLKMDNIRPGERDAKPVLFLHPMRSWHLYGSFKNGVNTGGRIEYVRWFSIIGIFVLLLACINFMNLSTARSEKRAREVGVRKAIGSLRIQLVLQFLSESVLMAFAALFVSLILVELLLPFFNSLAGKQVVLPWNNFLFWLASIGFALFTGVLAGSYPAFYLSGFKAVKVLKGSFAAGRFASLPRRALVVVQFTVSIVLIIGTIVVFRQVQFAKNRPVGYNRNGLVNVSIHISDGRAHFPALENDLKKSGAVIALAESGNPITAVWSSNGGLSWKGKAPGLSADFPMSAVSFDYGKTVGWQIVQGRDFSSSFPTDSTGFILNETAVKFMGLEHPVGEQISFNDGVAFTVVGVVKDFVMESPYNPVRPSLFRILRSNNGGVLNLRLNPAMNAHAALEKIAALFKQYTPDTPFSYKFVDEEYAAKFSDEERTGNLVTVFAVLAIFISALGLFGLASFVAEQRTREIGIRKVLGASVWQVWSLLSKEFIVLVMISLFIAIPTASYCMQEWLQQYSYRTGLSWWIFAMTGAGAIVLTGLTISFQAVKAALMNPVKSLRTE